MSAAPPGDEAATPISHLLSRFDSTPRDRHRAFCPGAPEMALLGRMRPLQDMGVPGPGETSRTMRGWHTACYLYRLLRSGRGSSSLAAIHGAQGS
jgi:hypothetical protein